MLTYLRISDALCLLTNESNSPSQTVSKSGSRVNQKHFLEYRFSGPAPELLNQNFWAWRSTFYILVNLPGHSAPQQNLRATYLSPDLAMQSVVHRLAAPVSPGAC